MRRPDSSARQVLEAYAGEGPMARLHTSVRWWTCPFDAVQALLPADGLILDLGCGHGHFAMYLAMSAPKRHLLGVDIDANKIHIGTSAITRAGLGGRVTLRTVSAEWRPEPCSYDAVVTNDVLYLMGRKRADEVLRSLAAAVRPGGVVVIKEVGSSPKWKHRVNEVQERVATRVLRITAGDELDVLSEEDIMAPLRRCGLDVELHELHRGYPHAHVAVVGHRGEVSGTA